MSITTDNIPPEVVEAAARAVHNIDRKIVGEDDWPTWEALSPTDKRRRLHRARAAILAALNAWPWITDARITVSLDKHTYQMRSGIFLPLPQPKENEG